MPMRRVAIIAGALLLCVPSLLACGAPDDASTSANDLPASASSPTPGATDIPRAQSPAATDTPRASATPTSTTPSSPTEAPAPSATARPEAPVIGPSGHYDTVQVAEDGAKHLIPMEDIRHGGPPKDGIPSIDNPQFVTAGDWDGFLASYSDDGLVIGVEVNGIRRAYPFQVLVWHEIVNDSVDGQPLLVTYCPLCGTGIVFVPEIDGVAVEFGVSGKLYNSDLLMYDRLTDSYWSQITGTAVVVELTGTRLDFYPSEIMTWGDWRATYPDSEVLSRETGYDRVYDRDPYDGYYTDGSLMFRVSGFDSRLHSKTRITGVELDDVTFGAYPDEAVAEHGPVNDIDGDIPLLVFADPSSGNNVVAFEREVAGQVLTFSLDGDGLIDAETGTRWSFTGEAIDGPLTGERLAPVLTIKGFWFAWYAFHQDTALWLPETE
jgi:hypothetical protein